MEHYDDTVMLVREGEGRQDETLYGDIRMSLFSHGDS